MAQLNTTGTEALVAEMTRLGQQAGPTAEKMLMAGAEIVRDAWRASAEANDHRITGALIDSITYSREVKRIGDARSVEIYPQGNDKSRRRVRNATKAYVTNFGVETSANAESRRRRHGRRAKVKNGLRGTHWVEKADEASQTPVLAEWEKIWNEYLKGR